MKWSVVGLVLVGLVAALSAAVLVAAMRQGVGVHSLFGAKDQTGEVTVLLATKDLPAMQTIDKSCVEAKTLPRSQAPQEYLSSPAQAIGKVLTVPLKEGQAFAQRQFAKEGSGAKLATALDKGMRAVSVSLTESGALYGLIYPGSIVDVLATFKAPGGAEFRTDPFSVTLLRGVPVIGVEGETVVSAEKEGETPKEREVKRSATKRWIVTLMVNSNQAKYLPLIMKFGDLSLAMRNPLDTETPVETGAVSLGQIIRSPGVASTAATGGMDALTNLLQKLEPGREASEQGSPPAVPPPVDDLVKEDDAEPQWEIQVIRGSSLSTVSFGPPGEAEPVREAVPQEVPTEGGQQK